MIFYPLTLKTVNVIHIKNLALHKSTAGFCEFKTDHGNLLRLEAHANGVYRLRCGSPDKLDDEQLNLRAKQRSELLLARNEISGEFTSEVLSDGWRLSQGTTALVVQTNPLRLSFYQEGQQVLSSSEAYDTCLAAERQEDANSAWSLVLNLQNDEAIYGLGRTTGGYNRRGQEIISDLREFAYLPLAWSLKGWGIYANSLHRVCHEVGTANDPDNYRLQVEDSVLDVFFFVGEASDIANQYSALCGRAGQPPLRAMGTWLRQQPGQTIEQFEALREELSQAGYAVDTLFFAGASLLPFQHDKLSVEWDETRLGDSRCFVANYLKGERHACVPTFPGVLADTPLFAELEDRGWLLNNETGYAHIFEFEQMRYGLLDLSYRDAFRLWQERHEQLLDGTEAALSLSMPIDIPDGVYARQEETGPYLRQLYDLLIEQALFSAVSYNRTPTEGVVVRKDYSLTSQRTPFIEQDAEPSFEGLTQLIRHQLSAQASGIPGQVHELRADAKQANLYLRSLAVAVFSMGFILPADAEKLPRVFDEVTQTKIKNLLSWRYRLIPYVLGIVEDAVRTGLPVQRMMPLAFPQDKVAHDFELQFMFGPALLVAPIVDKQDEVLVYLPEGEAWWDLNTSIRYQGGQVIQYQCDNSSVPVFGREGHMLCLGPTLTMLSEFNSARILDEVWMFGMPVHNPVVMRNKIRVMQMQGSSYIKGLEGLRILQSEGLEVKRRGAEVRISRER